MSAKTVREQLEPMARADCNAMALSTLISASKAISLKRIADALWGDEKTTGIVLLLNHIEANGRQN